MMISSLGDWGRVIEDRGRGAFKIEYLHETGPGHQRDQMGGLRVSPHHRPG